MASKKLNGFKDALKKHGISDIENRIHKYDGGSQQFNEIADFMDQVAKEAPPFHGVIAADDVLAVGCSQIRTNAIIFLCPTIYRLLGTTTPC